MAGHKPMKDRFTLPLCANASGDCKIKPLLVYHSKNPRAFKAHKIIKENLQVLWRANAKAWVTRQFFVEWVNLVLALVLRGTQRRTISPSSASSFLIMPLPNRPVLKMISWRSSHLLRCCTSHPTPPLSSNPWTNKSFRTSRNSTQNTCSRGVSTSLKTRSLPLVSFGSSTLILLFASR